MLKLLNTVSIFTVPFLLILIILMVLCIIYIEHRRIEVLISLKKEIINFYRLCKIVDNYLTRELNEKTTEEETKRLLKLIKELREDEKDINKLEEEI